MTKANYDVGYAKPPLHTRFPKGHSGNAKGRAKKTHTLETAFITAIMKRVTISENGKVRKVTKLDAAVTQLANDAARGDKKSMQLVFALMKAVAPICNGGRGREESQVRVVYSGVLAESDRTV